MACSVHCCAVWAPRDSGATSTTCEVGVDGFGGVLAPCLAMMSSSIISIISKQSSYTHVIIECDFTMIFPCFSRFCFACLASSAALRAARRCARERCVADESSLGRRDERVARSCPLLSRTTSGTARQLPSPPKIPNQNTTHRLVAYRVPERIPFLLRLTVYSSRSGTKDLVPAHRICRSGSGGSRLLATNRDGAIKMASFAQKLAATLTTHAWSSGGEELAVSPNNAEVPAPSPLPCLCSADTRVNGAGRPRHAAHCLTSRSVHLFPAPRPVPSNHYYLLVSHGRRCTSTERPRRLHRAGNAPAC